MRQYDQLSELQVYIPDQGVGDVCAKIWQPEGQVLMGVRVRTSRIKGQWMQDGKGVSGQNMEKFGLDMTRTASHLIADFRHIAEFNGHI